MKFIRRIAATAVAMAAAAVTGAQAAGPDLYSTPGGHISGGRLWSTTCEKYSATVVRCRTDIWATQVTYSGGTYRATTGWFFNNLTYLPATPATWGSNNLARNATWSTADGRQWRTECRTAATGPHGCRTWATAKVIVATKTASGYTYSHQTRWVLNNMLRFAESGIPAVTTVPADVLAQSRISFAGLGTLRLGASMTDLARLGYAADAWYSINPCVHNISQSSTGLARRGVELYSAPGTGVLSQVVVRSASFLTDKGAHVGMTEAQVKAIYGDAFNPRTDGGESLYAIIDGGDTSMVFGIDPETQKIDVITVQIDAHNLSCG